MNFGKHYSLLSFLTVKYFSNEQPLITHKVQFISQMEKNVVMRLMSLGTCYYNNKNKSVYQSSFCKVENNLLDSFNSIIANCEIDYYVLLFFSSTFLSTSGSGLRVSQ